MNGAKQNGLIGSSYWVVRCVEHSLHTRVFYVLRLNFLDHWKEVCQGDRQQSADGVKSFNFKQAVLKALLKGQARGIGYTGHDL